MMNNNKDNVENNVEDEVSSVIDQQEKDTPIEIVDLDEDQTEIQVSEQTANEYFETMPAEESDVGEFEIKESKQDKAIRIAKEAKSIVQQADDLSEECELILSDDLLEYEEAKKNLKERGLDTCETLLKTMGYSDTEGEALEEATVFNDHVTVSPVVIKKVYSGKFTAAIAALIAGSVTAVGMVYLATEKLNMTLNVSKIPSHEITEKILGWFSTLIGMEPNMYVGAGVLGISALAVAVIVYMLRVNLKAKSNLDATQKQLEEAEVYAKSMSVCKVEMEKVHAQMYETIKTFKTYEVLVNEQQGKLQRILHIEGEKEQATDYHKKSIVEIDETHNLLRTIKNLMSVSVSEEGKLSEEFVRLLEECNHYIAQHIEKIYKESK